MGLPIIYFDTETTGLRPESESIIELAAYNSSSDSSFCEFINPGKPIPPESSAIHNITDAMVADAEGFEVIGDRFLEFCNGPCVLVAHNGIGFDLPFLKAEYARYGKELPSEWIFLDSLKWARRFRPDLPKHTLQYLREYFGIEANNAHRALDDVLILKQVFELMIDDLSIEQVLALMNEKGPKQNLDKMPFGKHRGVALSEVPSSYIAWLKDKGVLEKEENQELKEKLLEIGKL